MQIQLNIYSIVLYVLCGVHIIYAQSNCSQLIKFNEFYGLRVGQFEISLVNSKSDKYVEVTVFVSDTCQTSHCSFEMATDVDTASESYKAGRPVPYNIYFRGASKYAWVKGVAVRGSNDCRVICAHEDDAVDSSTKTMKHSLHLAGEINAEVSPCDPVPLFSTNTDVACGVVPPESDFIHLAKNGEAVERGAWPWLVAIYHRKEGRQSYICGGTVISIRVILTAANCFYDQSTHEERGAKDIYVLLGIHDLSNYYNEEGSIAHTALKISIHPEYRPFRQIFDADIALIFTNQEIMFSDYIRPACIWDGPDNEDMRAGINGKLVGWSFFDAEFEEDSNLPKLKTAITETYDTCAGSDRNFRAMTTKRNFCAGDLEHRNSSPCAGDTGGGFLTKENNQWKVRGILSSVMVNNQAECDVSKSAIYTNIAKFRDWINNEIEYFSLLS